MFYFHGFPGSRFEGQFADEAARKLGLRLIAPERPGYGLSDLQRGRKLTGWPEDIIQLADQLNIEKFSIIGLSGGGPYAAACAWKIPDRIQSVTLICPLGQVSIPELRKDMKIFSKLCFLSGRKISALFKCLAKLAGVLIRRRPDIFVNIIRMNASRPDKAAFEGGKLGTILAKSFQGALLNNSDGMYDDFMIYCQPWEFSLDEIRVPVKIWHGGNDWVVPPSHGRFYADRIPGSCLELLGNEGHFSLPVNHMDEILVTRFPQ